MFSCCNMNVTIANTMETPTVAPSPENTPLKKLFQMSSLLEGYTFSMTLISFSMFSSRISFFIQ